MGQVALVWNQRRRHSSWNAAWLAPEPRHAAGYATHWPCITGSVQMAHGSRSSRVHARATTAAGAVAAAACCATSALAAGTCAATAAVAAVARAAAASSARELKSAVMICCKPERSRAFRASKAARSSAATLTPGSTKAALECAGCMTSAAATASACGCGGASRAGETSPSAMRRAGRLVGATPAAGSVSVSGVIAPPADDPKVSVAVLGSLAASSAAPAGSKSCCVMAAVDPFGPAATASASAAPSAADCRAAAAGDCGCRGASAEPLRSPDPRYGDGAAAGNEPRTRSSSRPARRLQTMMRRLLHLRRSSRRW